MTQREELRPRSGRPRRNRFSTGVDEIRTADRLNIADTKILAPSRDSGNLYPQLKASPGSWIVGRLPNGPAHSCIVRIQNQKLCSNPKLQEVPMHLRRVLSPIAAMLSLGVAQNSQPMSIPPASPPAAQQALAVTWPTVDGV